ncbi:MAG: hypothetical protein FWD87_00400 [Spirochaetaceae bacterium]|nr:hypothetical protein [Spirochaetaceae bacterium]
MQNKIIKSEKKSKLLALFCTLEEKDKDIVITMTESLVKQYKNNETKVMTNLRIGKNNKKGRFYEKYN